MSSKSIPKRAKNDFNLEALKRVVIFNNMYNLLKNIVFIEKRRCLEADDHPFADRFLLKLHYMTVVHYS